MILPNNFDGRQEVTNPLLDPVHRQGDTLRSDSGWCYAIRSGDRWRRRRRLRRCDCRTVELKYVSKAAELIHEAALAIQNGLTIDDIINLAHVFPTYSEVVKITAQAYKRDVAHMSCCVE